MEFGPLQSSSQIDAPVPIRYDMIRQESLTWTGKLSIQLYLAHVANDSFIF